MFLDFQGLDRERSIFFVLREDIGKGLDLDGGFQGLDNDCLLIQRCNALCAGLN